MLVRFSLFTSLPVSFCRHHSLRSHHFLWSFVPYVKGSARRKETGERGEEGTDEPSEPGSDMRKEPGPCVFRLLGLVSPSVLASRLSPSLFTIPGGAGPVRERTGPFGRHDDGGRERPKGPESEENRGAAYVTPRRVPSSFVSDPRRVAPLRGSCLRRVMRGEGDR